MENDEKNLPEENLEPKDSKEETPEDPKGDDPLDEIIDPEVLRAEAKKFRSISQRKTKPEAKPVIKPELKPELPTDVVRKSDLAKIATNQAKEIVSAEILEVWDELTKIPLAGYDPLDPKSIASNLKERFAIHQARNPKKDGKPDTRQLSETTGQKGTGGAAPRDLSKIKSPSKPENWYAKKE